MDLLSLLADKNIIPRDKVAELQGAAGGAAASPSGIEGVLLKAGVPGDAILKAKADYYQIPSRALGETAVPFDVLQYVPEESARHYRFAPLGIADGALEIGITDPDSLESRDVLNFISNKVGMPYKLYLMSETDFDKLLTQYKGLSGEVGQALSQLDTELDQGGDGRTKKNGKKTVSVEEDNAQEQGSNVITEDAPVTKIVATIVRHAVEDGASDIHIEPMVDQTRVRFRIDGTLVTNITLPPKVHPAVVSRIKVLSSMRLDEKRKPQDGRFSARVDGKKVDFRVSTFPTYWGEKVVMRILGVQAKEWSLESMGLREEHIKMLREAIQKPYGLILISGPTGSGKSTSLYSLLREVDTGTKNVLSLEDPIEYTIPGVSQSQVRPEIGYTFANGLRTTLRQDPNIIMVGEIRDKETAQLAVQAALTGHLVLSTIHTNDAVGIIPRLLDMEVDPYLIPPTLILGMAQRLVRKLCPDSGVPVPVEGSLKEMIDKEFADVPAEFRDKIPKMDKVHRAQATKDCPAGTRGRIPAAEMFMMSPELERAILQNKAQQDLFAVVRKSGMITLKEDAIIKSAQGLVPFEEVHAVGGAALEDDNLQKPSAEAPQPDIAPDDVSDTAPAKTTQL